MTDCNVMLGKIQPEFFPVGVRAGRRRAARCRGGAAAGSPTLGARNPRATGDARTPEQVAEGFVEIAVGNMANAIKQISVQRGHDVTEYTLCCFGGAGGQHACLVADALGMTRVFIHPLAGVLSAYGMGLADVRAMREQAVEVALDAGQLGDCSTDTLEAACRPPARDEVLAPGRASRSGCAWCSACTCGTKAPIRR